MNSQPSADDEASPVRVTGARLLKSTWVVGSMTLLSRILGLAREMVFSRLFGAGPIMDAFFVAFRIPNLLRRFFAEGAFSQAFVPIISEYKTTRTPAEARELIAKVSGTLALALFVITAIGVIAAPVLVLVFATGFVADSGPYDVATGMLRLTFPYIFFISLTALAGSVLNTYGRFAVPAFTPVLLNVVLIASAVWLAPRLGEPVMGLAVGVFVAGLVQLLFQLPFLLRAGLMPVPRWDLAHAGVRRILTLMGPALFGSSVAQINILFDTWIASFLTNGSISWLYYSDRLVEFPLGVFGIALATVILPTLSAQHAQQSTQTFSHTLDWALRTVLLIGLPAALGLMLLAEPIVIAIFYGGEFTMRDVAMTTASLRAFAPGLIGFILVKVLAPGYFARQDTKTPVRIAVRALLLGMVLNVVFVLTLVGTGWAPAHSGLAAATTMSGIANASMLLGGLLAAGVYRPEAGWRGLAVRIGLGGVAMAAFLLGLGWLSGDWYTLDRWAQIGWLVTAVAGGAAVYFGTCWLFGLRPSQFRIQAEDGHL
jgi:putative peptidoglycan lipid II flippase